MRITQNTMYNNLQRQLSGNADSLMRAQEVVATQKKINRLSDNPVDGGRVLDIKRAIATGVQYRRNIDRASNLAATQEQTLADAGDLVSRAKELMLREANEVSSTASTREATRTELALLTSQLVQMANTKYNGEYIFSGFKTDTPAFSDASASGSAAAVTGGATIASTSITDPARLTFDDYEIRFSATDPTQYDVISATSGQPILAGQTFTAGQPIRFAGIEVNLDVSGGMPAGDDTFNITTQKPGVYQGDGKIQLVEIQPGQTVAQNLDGAQVFGGAGGGVDIFSMLNQANTALRSNDRTQIDQLLGAIDQAHDQLTTYRTQMGGRINLLDQAGQRHTEVESNLEIMRGNLEDADLAEAITALNRQQNAYEATIGSASKIIQPSLLDFLR